MTGRREGNPEGALYGEVIVFTGMIGIPHWKAEAIAAEIGCRVSSEVTKKTTLLVEGRQDIRKLAGHEKSAKRRRAEELIEQGMPIKILNEAQFETLVLNAHHSYQRQLSLFPAER
jgi:DNA polymerase-3 subunit epsilon